MSDGGEHGNQQSGGSVRTRRALVASAAGAAAASLAGASSAEANTSSNQFVANGPAPYGFLTDSTSIDTAALLSGSTNGISVQGEHGYGGRFQSGDLKPQIHLVPRPGPIERQVSAAPTQFEEPQRLLPALGATGDFYFTENKNRGSGTLWLCVAGSANRLGTPNFEPAVWRQVLLGSPFDGKAFAID